MGRFFDTDTQPLAPPVGVATKHCRQCDQDKPLTAEFWPIRNDRRNAFRGICRQCEKGRRQMPEYKRREKLYQLRYYINHRDARIAANRRYKLRNHDYWLDYARRWNAERRPLDAHLPDIERWQRHHEPAAQALDRVLAELPAHLCAAIGEYMQTGAINESTIREIRIHLGITAPTSQQP